MGVQTEAAEPSKLNSKAQSKNAAAAPTLPEPNVSPGCQRRTIVFLVTAFIVLVIDMSSRLIDEDLRESILVGFEAFAVTFTIFGIIPAYFLCFSRPK